jgi:predicted nucleotidyltransferase
VNRALARRHAERDRLIEAARAHAQALARRFRVRRAAVVGSVARGDFNVWSDVDLLVVADDLPERVPDRLAAVMEGRPPRIEVIAMTPAEFDEARRRGNRLVQEMDSIGVEVMPLRSRG